MRNTEYFFETADYTEVYTKQSRQLKINYTLSGDPYFSFKGRRYRLDNFLRLSSAWASGPIEIKDKNGASAVLHGKEIDEYYKPLFIEIDDGGESVTVFRYERTDEKGV